MPLGLSVTDSFAWAAIIDQSRKTAKQVEPVPIFQVRPVKMHF